MSASRSRAGSGSNLDVRDAVADRDLPRAAKAAKDALDRGAHVQLATGILLGLGQGDVHEKSAAAVCGCFLDMLTCRSEDRRAAAARLLMTAMRAVTLPMPDAPFARAEIVSASGADIAVAQPNPDRAVNFARAMTKTMGVCEVADVLANSCLRVSKLHGTARNPTALAAMSRCALFAKAGVAVQAAARVVLSAAVRSMYVLAPDSASVSEPLIKALAATPKLKIDKPVPRNGLKEDRSDDIFGDAAGASTGDDDYAPSTDDKLSILWTFVPKDDSAIAAVARAAAEAAESSAPPEIKVIDGRGFLPPPTGGIARVRKFD